jgi:hypothetical protein
MHKYKIICKQDTALDLPIYNDLALIEVDCKNLNTLNPKKQFIVKKLATPEQKLQLYNIKRGDYLIKLALNSTNLKLKTINTILYANYNI